MIIHRRSMLPLNRDHGAELFRNVQDVSAGFTTSDPFTQSLTNVMETPVRAQTQAVSAFEWSFPILDWQRSETRSRSARARAISHSRSSAEASYWSL